jgi:hypothetical protein
MAWLAVNKDGTEWIMPDYDHKISRSRISDRFNWIL